MAALTLGWPFRKLPAHALDSSNDYCKTVSLMGMFGTPALSDGAIRGRYVGPNDQQW